MAFAERVFGPLAHIRDKLKPATRILPRNVVGAGVSPTGTQQPQTQLASALNNALTIPCPDPTAEDRDRDRHQAQGLKLARQEDWPNLSHRIAEAETHRSTTMGGMSVAELLAFGARADVVGAVEHALLTGTPDENAPLLEGILALEEVLDEHPGDPAIAAIVAKAHMDIGWAWRGTGSDRVVPIQNRNAFQAHFDRASEIVATFDPKSMTSALFASTLCAVHAGQAPLPRQIIQHYDRWITLDPMNTQALRALGNHLLPRWHGTYDQLELEARRTAGRTYDIWGAGAYTWVMFDAICVDPNACGRLDLEYFLDGLADILQRRPDQYTTNLLAAYCAITMGTPLTGQNETNHIRAQIADAAVWIVKDHLTELHPMLWAHAARGFDNAAKVRCPDRFAAAGYADALRYLTDVFRRELAAGQRVTFSKSGVATTSD